MNSNSKDTDELDNLTKETLHELCEICTSNDSELIYDFFECLFSKAELKDISNRWLLVKEIDKGTTQREIAKKFSMSLCKITRGSKELNKENSAFRKILDQQSSN